MLLVKWLRTVGQKARRRPASRGRARTHARIPRMSGVESLELKTLLSSYTVFDLPFRSPNDGQQTVVTDPADATASPFGWHSISQTATPDFTDTRGNNVYVQTDLNDLDNQSGFRPSGGSGLDFNFTFDAAKNPLQNQNAAVTQAFYIYNLLHDRLYHYGFTEAAGNYQVNNYGKGGAGGDPLLADIANNSNGAPATIDTGTTDTSSVTPQGDGASSRVESNIWGNSTPNRDGAFDNQLLIQLYGLAAANRLTSVPTAVAIPYTDQQSVGVAQGFGDYLALLFTLQLPNDTSNPPATNPAYAAAQNAGYSLMSYAADDPAGVRSVLYSTDLAINPHSYGDLLFLQRPTPAQTGEIWASALWDVTWNLINKYGFQSDWNTGYDFSAAATSSASAGNKLALQVIMEGMKLQPAEPSMTQARDGILQAVRNLLPANATQAQIDKNLEIQDEIWAAFARRGLGFSANDGGDANSLTVTEAYDIPATDKGIVQFGVHTYEPGQSVDVIIRDLGLPNTQFNLALNSSSGDSEVLVMKPFIPGVFKGTISTSRQIPAGSFTVGNAVLEVAGGDTLTVNYVDQDDGTGTQVTVTDRAKIVVRANRLSVDFESGTGGFVIDNTPQSGFYVNGLWHVSTVRGSDPGHTPTNSLYYGIDAFNNFQTGFNANAGTVTSPTINLNGVTSPILTFNYFIETENSTFWDATEVRISEDGGTFLNVPTFTNQLLHNLGVWQAVSLDLGAYIGHSIQIQFSFDTKDGAFNNYEGWFLDDITLLGSNAANVAPVLTASTGQMLYTLGAPAKAIDPAMTVDDADQFDFTSGTITVQFTAGTTPNNTNDQLTVVNQGTGQGQISVQGNAVRYGGVVIGTFTGGTDSSTPLVISLLNSNSTIPATQALMQAIGYRNPLLSATGTRTVEFVLNDGNGKDSLPVTKVIAFNNAPVISGFPGTQSINQDTSTGTLNFSVTDADSDLPTTAPLGVTFTSSDTTVVPVANIQLTSPSNPTAGGPNSFSFVVTPAPGQYTQPGAPVTISVQVPDTRGGVAIRSFSLNVAFVNTLPTIDPNPFPATTVNQNGTTGAIQFTVGDKETALDLLTVDGTSGDQSLVPDSAIVFGVDANDPSLRTVTITPAAGQSGATTITIAVNDADGGTSISTIDLTVAPFNQPPTISAIADFASLSGVPTAPINFTVGDLETPNNLTVTASSSNNTLIPNSNFSFSGSGASRSVVITPAANQLGQSTITITVTDGGGKSTTETFVLTIDQPPTISTIPNSSTAEDTLSSLIPFTINDQPTPAANLTVFATSTNPTLVPPSNIIFGGGGSSRNLSILPAADQNGSTIITVTVTDAAGFTATSQFTFAVTAVNDVPTLSAVGNQSTSSGVATVPAAFTVGDVDNAVSSVTVSAASSNTTLIPNSAIILSGNGASRTISVTPATNQSGTATITLTARDPQGGTTTSSFLVVVNAVNQLPTISAISDKRVNQGTALPAIPFTIGDAETPVASLILSADSSNLTLLPQSGIVFGGTGANRTVTLTPAQFQSGQSVVTITVTDAAGGESTRTFLLTVVAGANAPVLTPIGGGSAGTGPILTGAGQTLSFTISAAVPGNASATINYSAFNLPAGAMFNSNTQTFTWTPTAAQTGAHRVTFVAASGSQAASQTVTLEVFNVARFLRAYNVSADYHFFTISTLEFNFAVQKGYRDETAGNSGFDLSRVPDTNAVPLHRLYNIRNGRHYYTASDGERDILVTLGWRYEHDEGFIYTAQAPHTTTIFRLYNTGTGTHLYTESSATKDAILSRFPGLWVQHANLGFAFAVDVNGTLLDSTSSSATSAPVMAEAESEVASLASLGTTVASTPAASSALTSAGNASGIATNPSTLPSGSIDPVVNLETEITSGDSPAGVEDVGVDPEPADEQALSLADYWGDIGRQLQNATDGDDEIWS